MTRTLQLGRASTVAFALMVACAGTQPETKKPAENPAEAKSSDPNNCISPKDCLNKGALANQKQDFVKAAKFLEPACEIEAKACNITGELYRQGNGVAKDTTKAALLHQKACEKGLIISCAVEAQLRYAGIDGVAVDKARARIAFEKSCSPEFLDSCTNAGVMYASGEGGDADKDKARILYQKACDGGDQTGCVNAATMYLNGEGGPADKPRAHAMLDAACEKKNAQGCFNAALVYAKGLDGAVDLEKGVELFQKACDGKNQKGCELAQQIRDDLAKQAAAAAKGTKGKQAKK